MEVKDETLEIYWCSAILLFYTLVWIALINTYTKYIQKYNDRNLDKKSSPIFGLEITIAVHKVEVLMQFLCGQILLCFDFYEYNFYFSI